MVQLFVWFKQLFCDHQFEYEDVYVVTKDVWDDSIMSKNYKTVRSCKLCGYQSSYNKVNP